MMDRVEEIRNRHINCNAYSGCMNYQDIHDLLSTIDQLRLQAKKLVDDNVYIKKFQLTEGNINTLNTLEASQKVLLEAVEPLLYPLLTLDDERLGRANDKDCIKISIEVGDLRHLKEIAKKVRGGK